jgi:hypothetical protein
MTESKVKQRKDKELGYIRSLDRNTSRVEGRARASRWGLGGVTSELIIHTDLHKPNNQKLFSA